MKAEGIKIIQNGEPMSGENYFKLFNLYKAGDKGSFDKCYSEITGDKFVHNGEFEV